MLFIVAIVIVAICYRLVISKSLLESVVLLSAFSVFIGLSYLLMDAPDVTMTEVALGVCISTCVFLNLISIFGESIYSSDSANSLPGSDSSDASSGFVNGNVNECSKGMTKRYSDKMRVFLAILLCSFFTVFMLIASLDLPQFGISDSPVQSHLSKYYVENTERDIQIPSFVAAILASYRGFDTLGETTVILIAGIAVLLILSIKKQDEGVEVMTNEVEQIENSVIGAVNKNSI